MLKVRRAIHWQFIGLLVAVTAIFVAARFFPVLPLIERLQREMVDWGTWGAVCYPFLFAACNILLLPGGVLAVGSGFFFGLWWGFFIIFVGNVIGAAISFAVSRWIAGDWVRRKLVRSPQLRALEAGVERESWKIILLTQLHPLFPTSLLNYLYGVTRIRFSNYMLWASLGRIPGLFLYVYIGTLGQLGLRLMRGESHPRVIEYWIWGGAFLITALLLVVLARIATKAVQTSEREIERDAETAEQQRIKAKV